MTKTDVVDDTIADLDFETPVLCEHSGHRPYHDPEAVAWCLNHPPCGCRKLFAICQACIDRCASAMTLLCPQCWTRAWLVWSHYATLYPIDRTM